MVKLTPPQPTVRAREPPKSSAIEGHTCGTRTRPGRAGNNPEQWTRRDRRGVDCHLGRWELLIVQLQEPKIEGERRKKKGISLSINCIKFISRNSNQKLIRISDVTVTREHVLFFFCRAVETHIGFSFFAFKLSSEADYQQYRNPK